MEGKGKYTGHLRSFLHCSGGLVPWLVDQVKTKEGEELWTKVAESITGFVVSFSASLFELDHKWLPDHQRGFLQRIEMIIICRYIVLIHLRGYHKLMANRMQKSLKYTNESDKVEMCKYIWKWKDSPCPTISRELYKWIMSKNPHLVSLVDRIKPLTLTLSCGKYRTEKRSPMTDCYNCTNMAEVHQAVTAG